MCVCACVAMKRHSDDNEDKQPDKRPRLHQVTSHATCVHTLKHMRTKHNLTHQQVVHAPPGLVALPSTLARLLLSFFPCQAIPSLLGVSHTAQRLCACLHELDLSSCEELDDVKFVSSLVRLRTLNLSGCSEQLVDVSPLSSLTSLNALYLDFTRRDWRHRGHLADVLPLSALVALETLHLVGYQ